MKARFSFIISVDAIFTTLLKAAFTKAFNVAARSSVRACLWRARRSD
jgi:hypothetical protein